VKPGVQIITPNPKTSGNGKLSFLAAWGSVTERGGSEKEALQFVTRLYEQVPVLDIAARGATVTFVQRKIGDVHLTWENEAHLEVDEAGGEVEIVYPPISFLAEPPITWVDANVQRKGTAEVAKAYLEFLYTPEGRRSSPGTTTGRSTRRCARAGRRTSRDHALPGDRRREELGGRLRQVLRRGEALRHPLQAEEVRRTGWPWTRTAGCCPASS